jgi:queuine tRNA-ribosyltransferase
MHFKLLHTDTHSAARCGEITTAHGVIKTPIFMPVGTQGTVKGIHQRDLSTEIKAQIILGNTYHLYLRPKTELLKKAGGLHKFINWEKPILTDSGGYQVYSLAEKRKITNEGVKFTSHIDGSKHLFTPEYVMDIQREIGADFIMAFDECTPFPCEYGYAKKSMELTHRWLKRCCERFDDTEPLYGYSQTLLPIVQGSIYKDLRKISAETITSFNREANAIGGLSVGEPAEDMYEMTELVCCILPKEKPRYLMGVGTPANILECIALGIDMFDCVMPTRNARNGQLFTMNGIINIKNKKWESDFSPIDEEGTTFADKQYSKAYLRHLFVAGEMLGPMIASVHNLGFYLNIVEQARNKIVEGTFFEWKNKMVKKLADRI